MDPSRLISEIITNYERHGWKLRRALLTPETRKQIAHRFPGAIRVVDTDLNALWFARTSHEGREAWELRLVAENPYALFEAFDAEKTENDREEKRTQMEQRMREYLAR